MTRKQKHHSAEFKAKVALEAVKGVQTVQQLGKDFQVHPAQITIWKRKLTGQVVGLFKYGAEGASSAAEEDLRQAYGKVGRLYVELDWLTLAPQGFKDCCGVFPLSRVLVHRWILCVKYLWYVGCTRYCPANTWTVFAPFKASRVTLALKSALCRIRFFPYRSPLFRSRRNLTTLVI